jgi:hypothetical protein
VRRYSFPRQHPRRHAHIVHVIPLKLAILCCHKGRGNIGAHLNMHTPRRSSFKNLREAVFFRTPVLNFAFPFGREFGTQAEVPGKYANAYIALKKVSNLFLEQGDIPQHAEFIACLTFSTQGVYVSYNAKREPSIYDTMVLVLN